jgi:hypothetical protein
MLTSNTPETKEESRIDRCTHVSPSAARVPALFAAYHLRGDANQTLLPCIRLAVSAISKKLSSCRFGLGFVPVMLDMLLRRFRRVMRRMVEVTLSGVRVMRRHLVIALFVVRRRFAVMTRRVFVMFRCLVVMFCRLLRHRSSSFYC